MYVGTKALLLGVLVTALGCSARTPVTSTAPAPGGGYQLQAVEPGDAGTILAKLPARLSLADAQRLLVQIKPEEVRNPNQAYSLQAAKDGTMGAGRMARGMGMDMGMGERGDVDRTMGNEDRRDGSRRDRISHVYNNILGYNPGIFSYYPYGNYYVPYYNYGSYFGQYVTNCAVPYLHRFNGFFYPYTYLNPSPCMPGASTMQTTTDTAS